MARNKKLTLKPYTRKEVSELTRISKLPATEKSKELSIFAHNFKRSLGAVKVKMYSLVTSNASSLLGTKAKSGNNQPAKERREIALDIKSLRVEGNKLFISI